MRHLLFGSQDAASPALRYVLWLGLLTVYSGVLWLLGIFAAATNGWMVGAGILLLRLAGTLAVGVGLCAGERWAWAAATCLAAVYATLAAAAGSLVISGLASHPAALSWQPVAVGLNTYLAQRVLACSGALVAGGAGALWLLWRAQPDFDVPYRRSFTVLLHDGAWLAGLVLAADSFLVYHAWAAVAR